MEKFINEKIMFTTAKGEKINAGANAVLNIGKKVFNGKEVTFCRIDAHCDQCFGAEESISVFPEGQKECEYMSIEQHSPFWSRPFFSGDLFLLPKKNNMLLIHENGIYRCYIATCDSIAKTLIRGCESGIEFFVSLNTDNIKEINNQLMFVYGEGENAHQLVEILAKAAAELLGNQLKMRSEKHFPECFEYLGWCSWDALHIHVNHGGLLEKAKEFKDKKVPVHYAIVDDMWADTTNLNDIPLDSPFSDMVKIMHSSKIRKFEGDPKRFPTGMKGAIEALKAAGIPEVGIWFPTTGYWSGVNPDSELANELSDDLFTAPNGQLIVCPEDKKAADYFDKLCEKVKSWGGSFVKIDNQGFHQRYTNVAPIGQTSRSIQKAIDDAVFKWFDGDIINCMGMPTECMFNRPESAVSRCSDDFIPESHAWFTKNILQCAYNGLLQGQYYYNDWDMWWTDDAQGVKNSLCRSLSGGPVYVSDKIGRTRPEVLAPVTFDDGRLLRCDLCASPTEDCITVNPTTSKKPLKIFNRVGKSGLVALFNIDGENGEVCGKLSPEDAGIKAPCAYYEYFSGESGKLLPGEEIEVSLADNDSFKLYTFSPIENGVAYFGRTDKFISPKAIVSEKDGEINLYEGGKFSFYSETMPQVYGKDGQKLNVVSKDNLRTVVGKRDEKKLKIEF